MVEESGVMLTACVTILPINTTVLITFGRKSPSRNMDGSDGSINGSDHFKASNCTYTQ